MDAQTAMQLKVMTLELVARTYGKDLDPLALLATADKFYNYLVTQQGEASE